MTPAAWLNQGVRARLMYCFAFLNAFSLKLRQYIGSNGKGINRTSSPNVLKRSNRYVVAIILAIGFHALLLMTWTPTIEPIQLRLQSGEQSISLQLQKAAPPQERQAAQLSSSDAKISQEPLVAKPSVDTGTKNDDSVSTHVMALESSEAHQSALNAHQTIQKTPHQPVEIPKEKPQTLNATAVLESKNQIDKKVVVEAKSEVLDNLSATVNEQPEMLLNKPSLESVAKPHGAFAIAQPLSDNNPKYPRRAIIRNQQGRVKVSFLVDESGYVDNIELIESSGYALLDDSVFRFAEQERFIPATQDGIPIASNQSYLFRFVLQ